MEKGQKEEPLIQDVSTRWNLDLYQQSGAVLDWTVVVVGDTVVVDGCASVLNNELLALNNCTLFVMAGI